VLLDRTKARATIAWIERAGEGNQLMGHQIFFHRTPQVWSRVKIDVKTPATTTSPMTSHVQQNIFGQKFL
jgi:hypothetical protein